MKTPKGWMHVVAVLLGSLFISTAWAQQAVSRGTTVGKPPTVSAEPDVLRGASTDFQPSPPDQAPGMIVPRLVKFSSLAKDQMGQPRSGVVGVTFAIYKDQEGGAPLWMETQNVKLDDTGHFNVLLGATKSEGLPRELFAASESRWLGVQVQLPGEVEQPRVLLVSVPYALQAADAESLGGKPASAYALATSGNAADLGTAGTGTPGGKGTQATKTDKSAGALSGTAGFIPMFTDNSGTLGNSVMLQSGGNIGVGTTPVLTLDVNGGVRGTGLATGGRGISPDAINTNQLFLNGSNAMAVLGPSNAAFAAGALFTKTSFYSGGLERLTIDGATGNVGIGTVTPAARLDVAGNINSSGSVTATSFTGGGDGVTNVDAALLNGLASSSFAPATGSTAYVSKAGDTMTGTLNMPANGLVAGTAQLVLSGGNVGVGTASPAATLDVAGTGNFKATNIGGMGVSASDDASSGIGVSGSANGSSGTGVSGSALGQGGVGVFGQAGIDTNAGIAVFGSAGNMNSVAGQFGNESGGNILIGTGASVAKVFRVDAAGTVFANGGFACPNPMPSACLSTGSADFAEAIESSGEKDAYEPGDVLVIDSTAARRVALASEPYSTRVAGIYSTRPAVLGGATDEETLKSRLPLAMIGIVPCKVSAENGPVVPGDLLVTSSTPGYAMKGTNRLRMLGAVVGKALEPLREGKGVTQVLVTLQ